ncbi:MAG TPA: MlaD family protein [Kofleriaceae bacterium]|nr:MlaD family protein [Kofleriaceae bacterium]
MNDGAHKVRVALFALVGLGLVVLLAIGFGARAWHPRDRYQIEFDDTVYGLEPGGDVYFEGVRVGSVKAMAISHAHVGRVAVRIEIDRGTPIQQDTHAYLLYAGVTGVKEIDLRAGAAGSPALAPGGTIPVGQTSLDKVEDIATELGDRTRTTFDKLDHLVDNLTALTDRGELGQLVARGRDAADQLARAARELRAMIADNRSELHGSLASFDRVTVSAADLVTRLDGVVRGNAGQLSAALAELREAARSFGALARELRDRPSLLLFSRPQPGRR